MAKVLMDLPDALYEQLNQAARANGVELDVVLLALIREGLNKSAHDTKEEEQLLSKLELVQQQLQLLSRALEQVSDETVPTHITKH